MQLKIFFFVSAFLFSLLFVTAATQSVFAGCDSDKDCRARNGDRDFCQNPETNKSACVACWKNDQCTANEQCTDNRCIKKPVPTARPPRPPKYVQKPNLTCEEQPVRVILVMDTSNSMHGQPLADAKDAAKEFVKIISENPRNEIGIVTYDWVDSYYYPFGDYTTEQTYNNIAKMKVRDNQANGSCLECAFYPDYNTGAHLMFKNAKNNSDYKNIVIILSDGMINWWDDDRDYVAGPDIQQGREEAESGIDATNWDYNADMWAVHLGNVDGIDFMKKMVNKYGDSSGQYRHADRSNQLTGIYRQFANDILTGSVQGRMYADTNKNKSKDPNEPYITNQDVWLTELTGQGPKLQSLKTTTDGTGKYAFYNLCNKTYIDKGFPPANYNTFTPPSGSYQFTINQHESLERDFGFTPGAPGLGTVSGKVYVDVNENGQYDSGDTNFTQPLTISSVLGDKTTDASGNYTYTGVPPALWYNITALKPIGYNFTSSNDYMVKFDGYGGCEFSPPNSLVLCTNGNLTNANFGVTNTVPWMQTIDFSVRNDLDGFDNTIPPPATNACGAVMIKNRTGGLPGVVYSGDETNDFGLGQASYANWVVSGEDTTYGGASELKTSYDSVMLTLKENKKTPATLSCDTANCTITDANTLSNPYIVAEGDLTLNSVTLTNRKVVILVEKGDVNIRGNIVVPPGSFFMIITKSGAIVIDGSVGATTPQCPAIAAAQLQGIFSSDNSVIVRRAATCPTPDKQLRVAGSIITNAARSSSGQLINERSLCAQNKVYPSFTIEPRLDFIFSAPDYMLRNASNWQEVAP